MTFDPPGSIYTNPYGLNLEGAITGVYYDATGFEHGFLRSPTGKFTTFDPSPSQGTEALNINDFGEIAGDYFDANGITHGFLRSPTGTIVLWDVPGADQGTRPAVSSALTNEGTIAGDFRVTDSNVNPPYDSHGFLRHPDGTFTTFDVPGSSDTYMSSVNEENVTTGFWVVAHGQVEHAFVRGRDGRITTFDAPGAGAGTGAKKQGTLPSNINALGAIAGYFLDNESVSHGFVRGCDGTITEFDAPGAGTAPFQGQGTSAFSNNFSGAITGAFVDANGVSHDFLRE